MRVGFIGLGRMGQGMARRLLDAGHEMCVFDVVTAQTAPLAAAGARVARTIAELAGQCEVVVTMLVEDAIVTQVALGPSGLSSALAAGTIHLVMGTHGVATVRELESKHRAAGQTLVAAPVLGRPDLAASGQLGIVVAGPEGPVGRCNELVSQINRTLAEQEEMGKLQTKYGFTHEAPGAEKATKPTSEVLKAAREVLSDLVRSWLIFVGATYILLVFFLPDGLYPVLFRKRRRA